MDADKRAEHDGGERERRVAGFDPEHEHEHEPAGHLSGEGQVGESLRQPDRAEEGRGAGQAEGHELQHEACSVPWHAITAARGP